MINDAFVVPPLVFTVTGATAWCARPIGAGSSERTALDAGADETPEARPTAAILAASARRRATPLELVVAEVAGELLADLSPDERSRVRVVLGSRFGELAATHTILGSLTLGDGRVSPTAFSSSVHNASLGLVSIAQQIHAGTVAMSGGAATAYLCLVEAAGLLHESDAPVLVVLADEAPRPELGQRGTFPTAAIALRLTRAHARRVAADSPTCVVVPCAPDPSISRGHTTSAVAAPEEDVPSSAGFPPLVDESPAWWPLRHLLEGPHDEPRADGGIDGVRARGLSPLLGGAAELPMGTSGEGAAVLRVLPSDAHDGLAAAYDAMPHEPPARVVGFPAWVVADGLVCTVAPTQGDPFVQARRSEAGARTADQVDAEAAGAGVPAGEAAVDAVACLEWIAQAAAWRGGLDRVATDPTNGQASSARASGGALLATRCFHVHQRWLPLGVAYRVTVQRVVHGEGLARYEGTVTTEHGRVVASGDILVRSSSW